MGTEKNEQFFSEFRKLQKCVATLIRCQSYLDINDRKSVASLEALARKLEVSNLVQQREIIAVAGMQGTGKSTLVKNLYNLPDNILRISSERGEKIPVFITESGDLQPGEYRAREVSFFCGEKQISEIPLDSVAKSSRRGGNIAYIEVFVPYCCFGRDNAGFVLLPGFEKEQDRSFNQDYNSIMEYTLHFANAVVLVTDNSGIANQDICTLIDLLGKNFVPGNCIFAITKCDTLNQDKSNEQKSSLHAVCKEQGLAICEDQIVCTGEYSTEEENEKWKETFLDVVGTYIDYNAAKKEYTYFQPMVEEMCNCASHLEETLDMRAISEETISPIYDALKNALDEAESRFARKLEKPCADAKKQVQAAFSQAYDSIPKSYKRTKKLLFFEKSYTEISEARQYIEEKSSQCLYIGNGESKFIAAAREALTSREEKQQLLLEHSDLSGNCMSIASGELTVPQIAALQNATVRYYLDPYVENQPSYPDNVAPHRDNIAKMLAKEFEAFYVGMMTGNVDLDAVPLRTAGVSATMRAVSAQHEKNYDFSAAKIISLIDILDGKPDILNNAIALFTKGGGAAATEATTAAAAEAAGTAVAGASTAACAIVGVAIACVLAGKAYNAAVRGQNAVGAAWENALMNAVEEQKNNCLDSFHEAAAQLLDYVQEVHRNRRRIGDKERRIVEAKYAIDDIRNLANMINDKYADTLLSKC